MASAAVRSPATASSPWKVYTVESTGKKYWYNKETKAKSWKDPTAQLAVATKSPAPESATTAAPQAATPISESGAKAKAAPASQPWKEYEVKGKKYWYNKETKEKSWKNPTLKPETLLGSAASVPSKAVPGKSSSPSAKTTATTPANETPGPIHSKEAPVKLSGPAAKATATTSANDTHVRSSGAAPGKEAPGKSSSPAAKAMAMTPATETSEVPLPRPSKYKVPAPKNKGTPISSAHSGPKAIGPVAPHIPSVSASSPAPESTRKLGETEKGHGAAPDEHVTVQAKSKKKNWRGALDVGLKVLDSALEKVKQDDNLKKPTGSHAPTAQGSVGGHSHHDSPIHAATVTSAGNTTHPATNKPEHTMPQGGKVNQPKAASKLASNLPFKTKMASSAPAQQHEVRSIGGRESAGASAGASAGVPPASLASHPTKIRGFASSYSNGGNTGGEELALGAAPSHQKSEIGGDVAATGVGTVAGAVTGAAGYSAYDYYEQGTDSAAPTPPNEEDEDPTSGPPSPPSEENEDEAESFRPGPSKSFDPDKEEDDDNDNDFPPSPQSESEEASSAPPSPPNEYDSAPPSPPVQSDPGDDEEPPSPPTSDHGGSDAGDGGNGGDAGDGGDASDGGDGEDPDDNAEPPSPATSANPPPPPARYGPGAASDDGSDVGDAGDAGDAGDSGNPDDDAEPPSPAPSASPPPPPAAKSGPGAASDDDDDDGSDAGDGGDGGD